MCVPGRSEPDLKGDFVERREELISVLKKGGADAVIEGRELVEQIVFLENEANRLKTLPFILVNPKNPAQQKPTTAQKQYKETMQQLNNSLRLLAKLAGNLGNGEEESPLRQWSKSKMEREK